MHRLLRSILFFILFSFSVIPTVFAIPFTVSTYREDDPTNSKLEVTVAPGYSEKAYVTLTNLDSTSHTFQILAVDSYQNNGTSYFKNAVDEQMEIGLWTQQSELLYLEPTESILVPITISIPSEVALGEYYGEVLGVVVEDGSEEGGIAIVTQVGLGFFVHVVDASQYEPSAEPENVPEEVKVAGSWKISSYVYAGVIVFVVALLIAFLRYRDRKKK